jgi:programmed cell death protein 5
MEEYLRQAQEGGADAQQRLAEEAQRQELEELKRALFLKALTEDARDRLSNIRMARPDFALQLEAILVQLIQSGQVSGRIDEQTLLAIAKRMRGATSREFRILR